MLPHLEQNASTLTNKSTNYYGFVIDIWISYHDMQRFKDEKLRIERKFEIFLIASQKIKFLFSTGKFFWKNSQYIMEKVPDKGFSSEMCFYWSLEYSGKVQRPYPFSIHIMDDSGLKEGSKFCWTDAFLT